MTDTVIDMSAALKARVTDIEQKLRDAVMAQADIKTITGLTKELDAARRAAKSIGKMASEVEQVDDPQQAAQDYEILKADIRLNILSAFDYYWVQDKESFVLHDPADNSWSWNSARSLSMVNSKLVPNSDYWNVFVDVLKEDQRWFRGITASWAPTPNKLNRLRYEKLALIDEPHDPLFDVITYSVCGGKAENINHLERVLVCKYHKPDNFLLPVICFSDGGGTGKTLLGSTILTALFGGTLVEANCKMSDFAGGFNGHLCGKAIIMINENAEDAYNHERMKMIAGSPTLTYTDKGKMPFTAANTALHFVTGNSVAGSIRVDGGDVDRRFSVISGDGKLSKHLAPFLTKRLGKPTSVEEAEAWLELHGQNILRDRKEVAKWLNSLVKKHGLVEREPALHGADYHAAVNIQKPLTTQVFEAFFANPSFDYVRRPLVYEFYRAEGQLQGNTRAMGKGKFYKTLEHWLKSNAPNVVATSANWGGTTAEVYIDDSLLGVRTKPKLAPNDTAWFEFAAYGDKKQWKVAI